jgi:hypothetical protein
MSQKQGYRRTSIRIKGRLSGRNHKVAITTGVHSRSVWGALDQRFGFAKTISTYEREYREHVGEGLSVVMADYCRSAGTAKAIRNLALRRLMDAGPLDEKDETRAAYESYRKADADLREILRVLGLEKREKELPSLPEYLAAKAREKEVQE